MELFRTLMCNFIYFYRHSKWGDAEMPVISAVISLWHCVIFIMFAIVTFLDIFIDERINYVMPIRCQTALMCGMSGFIVLFLYYKIICGRRYIGTLKNPKYYTKSKKIFSACFFIGCFLLFVFSLWLMWARNNGLI